MVSVTQRIRQVKQPRGGYINPKEMSVQRLDDGEPPLDHRIENLHPALVGISVDYLVRLASGENPFGAFDISLLGARSIGGETFGEAMSLAEKLSPGRIDTESIVTACRLAGYDVAYRAGVEFYRPESQTAPDDATIEHIRVMVERSRNFFQEYGPITMSGFSFPGGYTDLVDSGDGDFLTEDTLWDLKVSVNPPTKDHTLQLLMYLLLGWGSQHMEFRSLWHLGIFNPRLNTAYRFDLSDLPRSTYEEVIRDVIGFPL